MTGSSSSEHPQVDAAGLIQALDDAVDGLLEWLSDWHATAICRETADPHKSLMNSLAHLDAFDDWFRGHVKDGIVNQPSVRRLIELNDQVRKKASAMSLSDNEPTRAAYTDLIGDVKAFIAQSRRLERAFAVAASDLDTLTGVQNRQALRRSLAREQERISRTDGSAIIAIADLDRFKPINDTHGHAAGDQVLSVAAGRLLETMRSYDQLFRYGGEEFLILLSDTEPAIGEMVLERLRQHLSKVPVSISEEIELGITASFGAVVLRPGETVEDAIKRADEALYEAKSNGRNRVVFNP